MVGEGGAHHRSLSRSLRSNPVGDARAGYPPQMARRGKSDDPGARERALDAAFQLFSAYGYSGTSIGMVQKESGVYPSSLYYMFGSKAGLLRAMIERSFEIWRGGQTRVVMQALAKGGPDDVIELAFDGIVDLMLANPSFMRIMILLALELDPEEHAESLELLFQLRMNAIETFSSLFATLFPIEDDRRAREIHQALASMAIVCIQGSFINHQVDPKHVDLRAALRLDAAALRALGAALVAGDVDPDISPRRRTRRRS